jgi:hypothetical protein
MSFFTKIDNILDSITSTVYFYVVILLNISYLFLFIGLNYIDNVYLHYFSTFVQVFVCIFLLIRFNPLRTHNLRKNDASIIFGSAILLLANLGIYQYIHSSSKVLLEKIPFIKTGVDAIPKTI